MLNNFLLFFTYLYKTNTMKVVISTLGLFFSALVIYSCGKCTQCVKTNKPSLTYCEGDFPNVQQYHDQIAALDSLGYTCSEK